MESPFETVEVVYYAAAFVVAFSASISQTLRSSHRVSVRYCINVGMVSGFLGFAVVSFIDGSLSDRAGHEFHYLGISALIGLSSRFHDEIIGALLKAVGGKIGIVVQESLGKADEEPESDKD